MATVRMKSDQKKTILLEMIRESKSFFKLQELETIGSKKGIVTNTIKDILQQLVDDGLIFNEKVGINSLYWSFTSDGPQKKRMRCKQLVEECERLEENINNKRMYVEKEKKIKKYTEERNELEQTLNMLMKIDEDLRRELDKFQDVDPEAYKKLISDKESVVDQCNKIIDNIFVVQDYVCNRFSMDKTDFNAGFAIPNDLDYIQ
ncbi:Mnd1-like meiotic recombination protein [Ordospora colligata]|uniref:Meiotic nuclear division protein 1 n=1 Tax=Ordospora colligata OC4 TaxID=1354746 RepID=A0A0B2UKN6_9MICR|nr:Mnd1-like meiotic recombination protein [Ordospora colligata OC4]KHN69754.1 Mnd1-like meiotic recombination protein [Ordospora colligata OC4]TBU15557.1 Mnd1-like meiotic recombination protein [Ordospora colligata]TBU15624.1 Mnd1-like meiotic recombination protein [Ordospora colligata]TBU18675.1 Mnd1-like meiotic recombination protein [Ordospora colligata]